jgi:hypothetical protein
LRSPFCNSNFRTFPEKSDEKRGNPRQYWRFEVAKVETLISKENGETPTEKANPLDS